MDDLIYFSESEQVEASFENRFGSKIKISFNGQAHHFLGLTIDVTRSPSNTVSIHLSQQAFIDSLLDEYNYNSLAVNSTPTPYKSGLPIDSIPPTSYPPHQQATLTNEYQHIVGSFQWLAVSTRPDIATVTNILAKYLSKPTTGHLNHCKHVLRYLKGTIDKGISFSTNRNTTLSSFVHFPLNESTLTGLADANWGPQDQSINTTSYNVPIFHSRSMSGYIQWLNGPLHWTSKRQTITARSTAEAEIYATDECTKNILHIRNILEDLHLLSTFCPQSTPIYNDNNACVLWSSNMTTKGLRHIQIRENAVRESIQNKTIGVHHIAGSINISDLFTKEDKYTKHFISLRDVIMSDRPL